MSEREIFTAALAREVPAERVAFLDLACAGDAPLRQRVESLLAEHHQLGSFMDVSSPAVTTAPPPLERPGTQIGPYKLLQQIGEGGFGVVFMAEQLTPVRRKVAVKVIKPGMDTRQVIARFEAERQALAVMDHPSIAKVLDAGTTDSGQPYFVMELVRGTPITQCCDDSNIPVHERLELFASVCQAIQHAHTKGIIHRDIKPTNVLITQQDGRPVVKVIDFGIAKAIGQQLTEKTLFTEFAQMIGTPLYMSPEQAAMSNTDIDTRSDIYSLGVLLYELLTGSTPVNKEQLKAAAFDEIRRIIREDEPPRPSTRISTAEAAASIAVHRHTEPAKLARLVRGELDWIVMKALDKDRNRRYETASAFAADVRRYLADEPVQACPPSATYRFRKFARRYKAALATATALTLTALLAIGSLFSALRVQATSNASIKVEQRQTQEALEREKQANDQLRQARAAAVAETYRALLGETQALRLARAAGWRETALNNLRRLAALETPQRDLAELRSEGIACLAELDAREVLRLEGHTTIAYGLDFSPDGKTLASAGYDGRVALWDLVDGRMIRQVVDSAASPDGFWTNRAPLPIVRFHPGGGYLAYTTWSRGIEFLPWGESPSALPQVQGAAQPRDIAFDAKGDLIAVSWGDGGIGLYNARTGVARRLIVAQPSAIGFYMPVALSPAGDLVASRGPGEAVQLHAVADESVPRALGRHAALIRGLAFSPDGTRLASASEDRTAKLWDVQTGKELLTLQGHTSKVGCIAFSPDGELLATGSDDGTLRLWETQTGQVLLVIRSQIGLPEAVAFSPDGSRVAIAFQELVVYQLEGRIGRRLPGHGTFTPSLAFHPRQPILASASRSNDITRWDVTTGREVGRWKDLPGLVGSLTFSPDGLWLAAAPFARANLQFLMTGDVSLLDVESGGLRKRFTGAYTAAAAFDPASRLLALGERDGNVSFYDVDSGKPLHRAQVARGWISEVAFLNDGSQLLVGEVGGSLVIWDVADARPIGQAILRRGLLRFAVDRGQRHVAAADVNGAVRILTLPDLRPIAILHGQSGFSMSCPAFSGDGRWLAVGGSDRRATIYDASTFEQVLRFPPQNSPIYDLAFQPGGPRLALGGGEEMIAVWDLSQVEPALAAIGLGWGDPSPSSVAGMAEGQPPPFSNGRGGIKTPVAVLETRIWIAEQVLQTCPDQPEFRMELAWVYVLGPRQFRDADKALPLARRAVELAPNEPLCLNTLGVVYYRLGQWQDAGETLRASGASNRDGPTAFDQFFLAMTYQQTGEPEKAKECYDQAVRQLRERTHLPPHEVAELREIRAEADALLNGEVSDQSKP